MGDYEIRPFRDEDEASLLETFNLVFSGENAALPPRTLAQWRWTFRQNPAGTRIYVAVKDGTVAAQYAAIPKRMWFEGAQHTFCEIVDSMVHPEHRAGLKRPGLFVKTALPFQEEFGRPDRDLVFFGWPVDAAWPISKRFFGYHRIRNEVVLAREPGPGPDTLPGGVEVIERFGSDVERLYHRCVDEWPVSGIRDDLFLNWRFVENPFYRYTCLGVRGSDGELRGYAIHRPPALGLPALIVDFLVHPDDLDVARLLEQGVLALARREGAPSVATLHNEWTSWFRRFQEWQWLVWPAEWIMVAGVYHPRMSHSWLRYNWRYQLGDLDVV